VITLCNQALEICPVFPGAPARIHWSLPDPAQQPAGSHAERLEVFREFRDLLRRQVNCLFTEGFLTSIQQIRLTLGSLLNNLTDGVMAHDLDRRIYYFNTAAERITGYKYREVIGRDCHEVFPGRFCGGDCSFCEGEIRDTARLRYPQTFTTRDGIRKNLTMSVVTTHSVEKHILGALVIFHDVTETVHLQRQLDESCGFHGMIGRHPAMQKVFEAIRELSDVNVPILIQGESGTGKEMVARALHRMSGRSKGAFVPVNCGALPEGTLESELFGHVRGAFTGAYRDKKGRFELADGGTLFLDEIGEISPAMQVKLLRALQDKSFVAVGGEKTINVDVRIICATNKDLKTLIRQGLFREDLYYRLAVVPVNMPPLRDRRSDIPLLINYFMDRYAERTAKNISRISDDALAMMMHYGWQGNIRELANAVQYALIKCRGNVVDVEHLPPEISGVEDLNSIRRMGRKPKLTRKMVLETLESVGGNRFRAAQLLGVSRTTLYRYLDEEKV